MAHDPSHKAKHIHHAGGCDGGSSPAVQPVDLVCGMKVDPATAKDKLDYRGKTYYFCCDGCLEMFRKDPERYLSRQVARDAAPAQVVDPVCGMTVDPASAAGSHVHDGTTYYFCSKHCLE